MTEDSDSAGSRNPEGPLVTTEGVLIPDSSYAAQLRDGFRDLRFTPELEQEFSSEHSTQHVRRMRIGFWGAIALYAVFLFVRIGVESGTAAVSGLVLRSIIIGGLLFALAVSYSRWRRFLPVAILFSYLLFGAGITAIEVIAAQHGLDRHYEGLLLLTIHCYVFSSLMLRAAALGGALIMVIYATGSWVGGLIVPGWSYELLFLSLTNLIAGAALYSTEYVERENFLRRHLLRELAVRDGLTGLYNRTAFLMHFERVLRQARREGRVLGLMMLDIDWFKRYNDLNGHVEGDACLRRVAEAIRGEFKRGFDLVARYGGEEFIGLWYDIDPAALQATLLGVRNRVLGLGVPHGDSPYGELTVSVGGIAFVPQGEQSLLELIRQADAALYAAKDRGRNTVVAYVKPSVHPAAGEALKAG